MNVLKCMVVLCSFHILHSLEGMSIQVKKHSTTSPFRQHRTLFRPSGCLFKSSNINHWLSDMPVVLHINVTVYEKIVPRLVC